MIPEVQIREVFEYQKQSLSTQDTGTQRELLNQVDITDSHVKIITGIRRCGKSTLLLQLMKKSGSINFLSFEDPRLSGFEVNDFFKLEKIFENENIDDPIYFFDEIQNVPGWEKFIRILHDKKTKVVISGSNASLLSKELGSSLTGRQLSYELYPFSYTEYLVNKSEIKGIDSFSRFMTHGGFPEYIESHNQEIHIQLFNDLIYRDIVVRYGIRNASVVKDLGIYLASNIGKEFSYNNLAKTFELGSVNTVLSYISFFIDAYLFFTIPQFSFSLSKQAKNPKKIYSIDSGLAGNLSLSFSKDKGRLLENLVFVELKRRGGDIFYFRKSGECDFITSQNGQVTNAIQVCYDLNQDNWQRETSGLLEAMEAVNQSIGLILTYDQTDTFTYNEKAINVMPVWKWLMERS